MRSSRNYNSVRAERIEGRSVIFDRLLLLENREEIREWADSNSIDLFFCGMGYQTPPFGTDVVGFQRIEFQSFDDALLCYLKFA